MLRPHTRRPCLPGRVHPARGLTLLLTVTLLLASRAPLARADAGDPIGDNAFDLEVAYTPVLGGSSLMGIAGAYTAIADGILGTAYNPAAWSSRTAYSEGSWDYDWTLGWSNVDLDATDLDNSGANPAGLDGLMLVEAGALLQVGRFGGGLVLRTFNYQFVNPVSDRPVELAVMRNGLGFGGHILGGDLAIGVTAFLASMVLTVEEVGEAHFDGGALELGMLYRPHMRPFRIGMSFRKRISAALAEDTTVGAVADEAGVLRLDGIPLPANVVFPAELKAGFVYVLGDRQLNRRPSDPVYRPTRRSMLVASDLTYIGLGEAGLGVDGWIDGVEQPTLGKGVLSLRLGFEWEVLPFRLRLRGGTYTEASRFDTEYDRLHATAGAALRANLIWDWSLSVGVDVAERYLSWGLSLGFWH